MKKTLLKGLKWYLIICAVILIAAVVYVLANPSSSDDVVAEVESASSSAQTVCNYEIVSDDDISTSGVARRRIHIYVSEDDIIGLTEEQIEKLMESIVLDYASSHKLNCITLDVSIQGDSIDNGASVGSCSYAPYGDIGRAGEVEAGDYSAFELCNVVVYSEETRALLRSDEQNSYDSQEDIVGGFYIEFGKLLECDSASGDDGMTMFVKVEIKHSYSNEATIEQNFFNVEDLIIEQGAWSSSSIHYTSVFEGSGEAAVSFVVNKELAEKIRDGEVVAIQMYDYVDDLYINSALSK